MIWIELLKDVGFPIFVAVFVLIRLEPAIKHLDNSITALTIVAAKSNGMGKDDIREIVEAIRAGKRRKKKTDGDG